MKIAYQEALQSSRTNPCVRRTVYPPNRLEAHNWDLFAALFPWGGGDPLVELRRAMQNLLGCESIYLMPSARCGIAQVLSLLPEREVVMPAFNCGVVRSAVEAAGKRIIYVDNAKGSVNATAAEFAGAARPGRILLITHMFGVPTDVEAICDLARSRGCVTIEDAACSFGAKLKGQPLGTFADFGIFSFENWKRLPAFHGGAVVVNNPLWFDPARLVSEPLVKTTLKLPVREMVSAVVRNLATIPWLYGRVTLPMLVKSYFKPSVAVPATAQANVTASVAYTRAFHPYQARLILRMLRRMERIRRQVVELTTLYCRELSGGGVAPLLPDERDDAGLLRFPVVFPGRDRADILRRALQRGLYLETEFEEPLPPRSEWDRFPNAVWAGRNVVLLPLYASLTTRDAAWLAREVVEIAREVS